MVNRSISPGTRAAVLDRDGHQCSYCGSTDNLTIDHILPVALGGLSIIENLRTLCGHCNTSKGSGDRPVTVSSEKYYVRTNRRVLSHIKGDLFRMTRDELAQALEEYPEKLKEALLRQYQASVKLEEARVDAGVPPSIQRDDDFDFNVERARLILIIRKNPSDYGIPSKPNETAIQEALLASPEYAELQRKQKELRSVIPYTRDKSILMAKEEKVLADIEVEVLRRTFEAYRILADIMRLTVTPTKTTVMQYQKKNPTLFQKLIEAFRR